MSAGFADTKIPILLFNDDCKVCRRIGHWVERSARTKTGIETLSSRPIGHDPEVLRSLNADLDIWDAYATIHLLMPSGTMKIGGDAVGEVLNDLPKTRWFAWLFRLELLGVRPFQALLDLGYELLSDIRPLLGCSGCGTPAPWVQPLLAIGAWFRGLFTRGRKEPAVSRSSSVATSIAPKQGPNK